MKTAQIILTLMLATGLSAMAEETMAEKTEAKAHNVKRSMKKGAHRTQEAVCMEGDVKCMEKKAAHRMEEAKDYTKDKASEAKNAVDSDASKK